MIFLQHHLWDHTNKTRTFVREKIPILFHKTLPLFLPSFSLRNHSTAVFHCHPASATIFVAIANIDARRSPLFPMYETSVSSGALLCGRPWRGCDHGWFALRSSPPPPAWSVITTIVTTMVSRHLAVVRPPPHTSRRRRNPRPGVDANALKHLLA